MLALPNMFTAGAVHRIGRLLLGQLPFADWAGFGHYISHDLASLLTGTIPLVYQPFFDVRKCNKAACRFISAAACLRRLPFVLLKSRVVTLCSQKVHVNEVPPFIGLVV